MQPCPPSDEPSPRRRSGDFRRRSGDPHTRSGDPHKRSDHIINMSENESDNIITRSGDARMRSHDQTIVCNAEKQPHAASCC